MLLAVVAKKAIEGALRFAEAPDTGQQLPEIKRQLATLAKNSKARFPGKPGLGKEQVFTFSQFFWRQRKFSAAKQVFSERTSFQVFAVFSAAKQVNVF